MQQITLSHRSQKIYKETGCHGSRNKNRTSECPAARYGIGNEIGIQGGNEVGWKDGDERRRGGGFGMREDDGK
jgi:hypothetical protein